MLAEFNHANSNPLCVPFSRSLQREAGTMPQVTLSPSAEAVRLVVWDLDETFWRGTLTEGGIREYIQEHHDIIIELARRGIMSSVCSKNDHDVVVEILADKGILDYIVFPSISWEPKGRRLAALVDAVQLRAPTVMFIDDNPTNLAEAQALVPGIQVENDQFIAKMLTDPRFRGKNDSELLRLKQYKLLESRKRDQERTSVGNEDFLRGCDVRIRIEYDVESHLDRAIELVNRTNQLNYTKKSLPENLPEARILLKNEIRNHDRQAGLIHVRDKYGDYGFVGFFETETLRKQLVPGKAQSKLIHYCFSCRTLGMLIEKWVYDYLRQPELEVVGDVLTDVSVDKAVDWITLVSDMGEAAPSVAQIASRIVVWGGCEGNALGVYLRAYAPETDVFGNFASSGMFTRINSAVQVIAITLRDRHEFAHEAMALGLPLNLVSNDIFNAPRGTLFVVNASRDAGPAHYFKHKEKGWLIHIEPRAHVGLNILTATGDQILDGMAKKAGIYPFSEEEKQEILRICGHVKGNYELYRPTDEQRLAAMRSVIESIPIGCKVIFAVNHHRQLFGRTIRELPEFLQYASTLKGLAAQYDYIGVACYADVVGNDDDIQAGDHFVRSVYHRFSELVVKTARALNSKSENVMRDRGVRLSA